MEILVADMAYELLPSTNEQILAFDELFA